MPWDGTELWAGDLNAFGAVTKLQRIAGGSSESIFQPEWSPGGALHFISDRSGWWNLYAEKSGRILALAPMAAEYGLPQWQFGYTRYAFLSDSRIACIYRYGGRDYLGVLNLEQGRLVNIETKYTTFGHIHSDGGDRIFVIGSSPICAPEIVTLNVRDGKSRVLKRSQATPVDSGYVSEPESIEFPTSKSLTAYAFFYPPKNKDFSGPPGERPPLIVVSHGGPTVATSSSLRLAIQFWTSRGFAVVDVDYGGSTGYGREYRERLRGQWGIVDVEDCINAARFLANRGDVDPKRMAIRGGSAGGYTTLCALVFHKVFSAGASYYGVADIEALSKDTHKFESHYEEGLIDKERFFERSPVHFADRLSCPVILFQGLEDKVVPPAQTAILIDALRKNRLPFEYIEFPTEGHGFREAANIQRAAEAELRFYGQVFGFPVE
jgi:dipeptidyl aminopeptidase/acylaminoacyl peptidase